MSSDYPSDHDINYSLFHVYQYDEVNINGIDIAQKFDFFDTFKLILHYTDGKISAVTFNNEDISFFPYSYEIPAGKVDAYLDTTVLPNELRITGSGPDLVIAYFVDGEFSIPFKLDCPSVDYKYTFKSVNQ
ncbi:MAG: hypothetical protein LUD15_02425 [Bacteroides sp.]|nr:hypothetical protein [Bacteroides sp.]